MNQIVQMMHVLTLFSATAAGSLVSAIWEGTILAASVALCLCFVKGITAGVRSILWTGVLLLVVLLHFVPLLALKSSGSAAPGGILHADLRWSMAILCLWGVLSLVRGTQLIHSAIGLRRIARRAAPVIASPGCASLLSTSRRSAQLCTSTDVDRPSVIGFFSPRILIPQTLFEKLSAFELEQIVMHEMEHLRRADDWTNLLQKVSLVLFPLNPVLLWVEHRLCMERELACDDHVLHCTQARKAYATCLVNLAEESVLRRRASLALGAWERQTEVGRRVRRILRQPEGIMGRRKMATVTGMLALCMVGGAIGLAREPRLVSFAPTPSLAEEASFSPASGYVPASFHERSASPKMIDTVFHEPRTEQASGGAKPAVRHSAAAAIRPTAMTTAATLRTSRLEAARARLARRRASQSASWVVLTDWSQSPEPPQVRLVVSPENQRTYAAIQMANGWLIVQL